MIQTLLLLFTLSSLAAPPLPVSHNGKELSASPSHVVEAALLKVYEPQEKRQKNYRGWPVLPLLEKIYGKSLVHADVVSFYCTDGYRADIPLKEFKEKKSLLAFEMADGSKFELSGAQGPIVLSPFYLVWDHPDAAAAAKDVYRWPYAVEKIDVIESKKAYQPLEAPPEFRQGRDLFMNHCFSCHSINGAGGRRGPPLNPFFASQTKEYLISYALDPKKHNPNSQMSGLSKTLKHRDRVAEKIINYGKKIAKP